MHQNYVMSSEEYLKRIQQMYEENSINPIREFCTMTQQAIFQKELDVYAKYGLKKQLHYELKPGSGSSKSAVRTFDDGKVCSSIEVFGASTNEKIRNQNGRAVFRDKIKHAFFMLYHYQSKYSSSNQEEQTCINCGGVLTATSAGFDCEYCGTHYQAEVGNRLLSRFYIENALRDAKGIFVVLALVAVVGVLSGVAKLYNIDTDTLIQYFSYGLGGIITVLIFIGIVKGISLSMKNNQVLREIRKKDPHFSREILQQRVLDLLQMHPEYLGSESEISLVKSIDQFYFDGTHLNGEMREVNCRLRMYCMNFSGQNQRVKIKKVIAKERMTLCRHDNTQTPVYYRPEQYTCPNCGSHQHQEIGQEQICSCCGSNTPMEQIDWVLK